MLSKSYQVKRRQHKLLLLGIKEGLSGQILQILKECYWNITKTLMSTYVISLVK